MCRFVYISERSCSAVSNFFFKTLENANVEVQLDKYHFIKFWVLPSFCSWLCKARKILDIPFKGKEGRTFKSQSSEIKINVNSEVFSAIKEQYYDSDILVQVLKRYWNPSVIQEICSFHFSNYKIRFTQVKVEDVTSEEEPIHWAKIRVINSTILNKL